MKASILVTLLLVACSADKVAPPMVPAPIELAANPRPAPSPPSFHGVVTSRVSQMVTATDAGVIKELRVGPGDIVEAGQVLAILDDPAQRAMLAKMPKRSKARIAIEKRLANMKIVAPVGGIVSSIQTTRGASATPGMPILRVSSTKRLQLRFALPQDAHIANGTKVTATIAGRAKPIAAVVRSVTPTTDASLHLAIVDADISTRDIAGLHGALADVTVVN
jgi:multidrug efflux pump subunit AcrA (membrane-fusion protein)